MTQPEENIKIIHAAYPDMPINEVYAARNNAEIVTFARYFASRNEETYKQMRLLSGHFDDLSVELDGTKINPFFKAFLYKHDKNRYTLMDLALQAEDYKFAQECLTNVFPRQIFPKCFTSLMNLGPIQKNIRKTIFHQTSTSSHTTKNEIKKHAKQIKELDAFLSHVGELISIRDLWERIFRSKIPGYFHPEHKYTFTQTEEPQTMMDVCLSKNLPLTAIVLINETRETKKTPQSILALFSGKKTQELLKNNQQDPTIQQVVQHLEKVLPTNMYLATILHKPVYHHWQRNFEVNTKD